MGIWSAIKDGLNAINPLNAISSIFATAGDVYNNERNIDLQQETNKLNYQIFQEGNEFNALEAGRQRLFESEEASRSRMFNAQEALKNREFQTSEREATQLYNEMMYNKYESPQAMAAQYLAAGINPVSAAGQQGNLPASIPSSGSQATSSPVSGAAASSASVGNLQSPRAFANPFDTFVNSIAAINSSFSQSGLNDAQAALLSIDAETRRQDNITRIEKSIAEKEKILADKDVSVETREKLKVEIDAAKENLDILRKSKDYFVSSNKSDADLKDYAAKNARVEYLMNDFRLQHQQELYDMEVALGSANVENLLSSAKSAIMNASTNYYNARTGRMEFRFNKAKATREFKHQVKMDKKRIYIDASNAWAARKRADNDTRRVNIESKNSRQSRKESSVRIEKMYQEAATDMWNSAIKSIPVIGLLTGH